jgi:polysaccharide biosynthesis/export protein
LHPPPVKSGQMTAGRPAAFSWRQTAVWLPLLAGLLLQGCALPRSAPLLGEVSSAAKQSRIDLSQVTPDVAAATREPATASFPPAFRAAAPVDYEKIVAGDGIDIVIWERDGLQMFPPGPTGASDLGVFTVRKDGSIDLPYLGTLRVAGLTPADVRTLVLRQLRGLVIAMDARVSFVAPRSSTVTVQGDVTKAGVYPIQPGFLRLSDALALASPDQTDPEQTAVTIRRDGAASTVRLSDIYNDSAQDIALRPGDSIVVSALQQFVAVVGAAGLQGRVKITKRNYSVLDAIADSKGLADALADPRALFLIRARTDTGGAPSGVRPLVYQFNMTRPEEILLARQFAVKDGDALFVSDAPYTQVQKVLSALSATLGTARDVSSLSQ